MIDNTINALRLILGIPFLLFFPGYSLLLALIPKKESGRVIETITLSVVLSIVVVALLGLLINYTPWGITLETILCAISVFILACLIVAWYRIRNINLSMVPNQAQAVTSNTEKLVIYGSGTRDFLLTLVMILMSVGVIVLLTSFISAPKNQEEFTSFYIVEQDIGSGIENIQLKLGEQGSVTVGIKNQEGRDTSYTIGVFVDEQKSGEIGPITVQRQQEWQGVVTFTPTEIKRQKIELKIFRNNETTPYLSPLYFWVDITN